MSHPASSPTAVATDTATELTILMPCLNEAETLAACIREAQAYLDRSGVQGEILIADNGSTDGSQAIGLSLGVRVIDVPVRGYGAALQAGIAAAHGRYVIMGDADMSYDFSALQPFVDCLLAGADLVMGNRFNGRIEPRAMPLLHRYLGNPVLSFLGRLFFKIHIGDFHCGLRGFARERILALGLTSPGMEFASEMVVRASRAGYAVAEVPTRLRPDGRSRPPHLRTWRDGWRHLRFMLMYSPSWLFLYPGITLILFGLLGSGLLLPGPVAIGGIVFDIHTLMATGASVLIGMQLAIFAMISKRIGVRRGYLPASLALERFYDFRLEPALLLAAFLVLLGGSGMVWTFAQWIGVSFGRLDYPYTVRVFLVSLTVMTAGIQLAFSAFLTVIIDAAVEPRRGITAG
jgi:glycosyltransferase involved in cell wall biosynthesis